MASRQQNERRFPQWEDTSSGGRRYYYVRRGPTGGFVRYVKTVDADEVTLSFIQEVYDSEGSLVSSHRKYPTDTGHRHLR